MSQSRFVLKEYGQLNLHNHNVVTNTAGSLLVDNVSVGNDSGSSLTFTKSFDLVPVQLAIFADTTGNVLTNSYGLLGHVGKGFIDGFTNADDSVELILGSQIASFTSNSGNMIISAQSGIQINTTNSTGNGTISLSSDNCYITGNSGISIDTDAAMNLNADTELDINSHDLINLQTSSTNANINIVSTNISLNSNNLLYLQANSRINIETTSLYQTYTNLYISSNRVNQLTSFATPVQINTSAGKIVTFNPSTPTQGNSYITVNSSINNITLNSLIQLTINNYSGTGLPSVYAHNITNDGTTGSFQLHIINNSVTAPLNQPLTIVYNITEIPS